MNNGKAQLLKISQLQMLKMFYPRERPNNKIVEKYAAQIGSGIEFPPIIVGHLRNHLIIVDGWHRTMAHIKLNLVYISGIVIDYQSEKELFADAVKYNNDHGYGLSMKDRERSAKILKRFKFTVDEITKLTCIGANDVKLAMEQKKKASTITLTGPGGKKVVLPIKHNSINDIRTQIVEAVGLTSEDTIYDLVSIHANGQTTTVRVSGLNIDLKEKIEPALETARGDGYHELAMVLERAKSLINGTNR